MRQFGDLQFTIVNDGYLGLTNRMLFFDAPDEEIDPYTEKHENGGIKVPMFSVVIKDGDRTMLVDTGLATRTTSRLKGGGNLVNALNAAGIETGDITDVVLTHAHGDHIGWNTVPDTETPALTFQNARYWLHEKDWKHFTDPTILETSPLYRTCLVPLERLGALELFSTDIDISPNVRMQWSPGHSPGHCCVLLNGGKEQALILGDVTHHPLDFMHPDWNCQFDVDFDLTRQTRHRVLDQVATDGILLMSYHHPNPLGRAEHYNGAYRWSDEV